MSSSSSAAAPPVERPSAVFSIGINGLTSVVLSQPGGYSAEVLLYGGQVKSWKNKRGDELLFISKKAVFEPYNPIRGGIPICFPTFINNGGTEQLGFARLRFWEVDTSIDLTTSSDKASIDLILRPTHDDLLNCPNQFEFRLRVILEPNGDLKMNSHIPQDMDTDVSRSWGGVGSNNGYYDYSGGGNNDDGNDDMLGEDYEVDDDGEGSDDDSGEGSDDDSGEGSDDDNGEDSDDDDGEGSDDDNGEDSDDDDGEGSDDDNGGKSDHEFDNALYRPYWFNDDFFWQANEGGHLTKDDCIDRHRTYLEYERDYSYDYEDDHGVHRYVCYDPPEGARPEDIDFIVHHEEKLRQGLTNNQIACPPYWPNAKSGPDGEPIRDWDVNSHIPWHVQLEEKERARRAK